MKIKLLDGSLSYPLEKKGVDLNSRLWTAQVLIDDPIYSAKYILTM